MSLRIAVVGSSPCQACTALCCKQNGHDFAVLLEGDDERRRFAAFAVDVAIGDGAARTVERVLPYRQGRCQFLGEDDLCTIYEDRPIHCRRFECVRYFHTSPNRGHGVFLLRNPKALELIDRW